MMTAAEPRQRSFQIMQSRDMVRLVDRDTGAFLHLSGQGVTGDINYSWLGYRRQAQTLRERALVRGEAWPFQAVHRDDFTADGQGLSHEYS